MFLVNFILNLNIKVMKSIAKTRILRFAITLNIITSLFMGCENNGTETPLNDQQSTAIPLKDQEALLFMLEEEKLARDTYIYLDELWSVNQFSNIQISEQSHLDAVAKLLDGFGIEHTILPEGEFMNQEIQDLYDTFIEDGALNLTEALYVGATIEDLDIVDLEDYINATSHATIISVYERLQCGSRNHLRSFVSALENAGGTYIPQFLTIDAYELIKNAANEQCGR